MPEKKRLVLETIAHAHGLHPKKTTSVDPAWVVAYYQQQMEYFREAKVPTRVLNDPRDIPNTVFKQPAPRVKGEDGEERFSKDFRDFDVSGLFSLLATANTGTNSFRHGHKKTNSSRICRPLNLTASSSPRSPRLNTPNPTPCL